MINYEAMELETEETEKGLEVDNGLSNKWGEEGYQPSDPLFYHFTKGLSPYKAKYFLLFSLPKEKVTANSLFAPKYEGEIKGKLYVDYYGRPIKKDDYVLVFSKQDRGFFRVVNYRGSRVVIEDESRGGRVSILPKDLFVVTDQIKANVLNKLARSVKMEVGYDNQNGQRRVIKAVI